MLNWFCNKMCFQKTMKIKKIELVSKSIWNESVFLRQSTTNGNDAISDSDLQWLLDRHRDGRHQYQDEDEDPRDHLRRGRQHVHGPCQRMRSQAWPRHPQDRDVLVRLSRKRQLACAQMDRIHWQLVQRSAARTRHHAIHVQQWSHASGAWRHVEQRRGHLNTSSGWSKRDIQDQDKKQKKNKKHFF